MTSLSTESEFFDVKYTPNKLKALYETGLKRIEDEIHQKCEPIFNKFLKDLSDGKSESYSDPQLNQKRLYAEDFDKWLFANHNEIYVHLVPFDLSGGGMKIEYYVEPKNPKATTLQQKKGNNYDIASQYR